MSPRDPALVTSIMRKVRGRDTSPELALRRRLWRRGLRYRLHSKNLPGKPDIVFPRPRVAIFVDGDFWHGNQWRIRGLSSLDEQFADSPNAAYWVRKIGRNAVRDGDVTLRLEYDGWRVIRLWESDLKRDMDACVRQVLDVVRHRSQGN